MSDLLFLSARRRPRIAALRISFVLLLPLMVIVQPLHEGALATEIMEQLGLIFLIGGVLGRFWSILYIGGHKNEVVMKSGPYSVCRHPLYLFSTLAAFGFGLMLQSVVIAVVIATVIFTILSLTARREETFLTYRFGTGYSNYAKATPRILPDLSRFSTNAEVTFNVDKLRGNFFDALVFIALIPAAELIEWVRETRVFPALLLP